MGKLNEFIVEFSERSIQSRWTTTPYIDPLSMDGIRNRILHLTDELNNLQSLDR